MGVFSERESPEGAVEVGRSAAERLTFFSDAVIAIAITLLALELPLPSAGHPASNHALLQSAGAMREEYLAFLISFIVIAAHWRSHHRVFRYVTKLGTRLTGLTLLWLLMLVITPFATKVLTGDGAFQARFIFYALVECVACGAYLVMLGQIRRERLFRDETPPRMLANAAVRIGVQASAFLVSIPIAFFTEWAYACWFVIPFLGGIVLSRTHRQSPD